MNCLYILAREAERPVLRETAKGKTLYNSQCLWVWEGCNIKIYDEGIQKLLYLSLCSSFSGDRREIDDLHELDLWREIRGNLYSQISRDSYSCWDWSARSLLSRPHSAYRRYLSHVQLSPLPWLPRRWYIIWQIYSIDFSLFSFYTYWLDDWDCSAKPVSIDLTSQVSLLPF